MPASAALGQDYLGYQAGDREGGAPPSRCHTARLVRVFPHLGLRATGFRIPLATLYLCTPLCGQVRPWPTMRQRRCLQAVWDDVVSLRRRRPIGGQE